MGISTLALIVGLLVLAGAALWGLYGIDDSLGRALTAYDRLKATYDVALSVQRARGMLEQPAPDRGAVAAHLRDATKKLYELPLESDARMTGQASDALVEAQRALDHEGDGGEAGAIRGIDRALDAMERMSNATRREVAGIDDERRLRRFGTMVTLVAVSLAVVLIAVVIGFLQYRSVIGPLRRLGVGVRRLAVRRFDAPLAVQGDAEFAQLAEEFNRMAGELDGFYRGLEEKVDVKSRELIRSERLASVGFLAAGVAHEINNPLAIISGHAELAGRSLSRVPGARGEEVEETARSLRVIAEEAMRCKEITGKLLGLIRGGGDRARVPVDVRRAAEEVGDLVAGLPRYRGRLVAVRCDDGLRVSANQVELKQVLLNLVVNALEATADFAASVAMVEITARAGDGVVEVAVADNGRGMSRETLTRVFEPFFTSKRGVEGGGGGIGLGLAITHAIVETHGGRIRAESRGAGMGSRFIMEWPVAT